MNIESELKLIPEKFKILSISDLEIVLPYPEIIEAMEYLKENRIGFLGWEGWAKYEDNRKGHFGAFQGTESIEQKQKESWKNYVKRGFEFCKETIEKDYHNWSINYPPTPELYFCLSIIEENDLPFYDDDYDTCVGTYVTLRIYSGELNPQEITEIIKIEPTHINIKDKGRFKYENKNLVLENSKRKEQIKNGWFLSSENLIESMDTRRHLDFLLDKMILKKEQIKELKKKIEFMDISCLWSSKHGMGGPTLSPYQLKKLAELEIEIWFEIFSLNDIDEK